MAFQVITDPDKLRELGKARLLWYYVRATKEWNPSVTSAQSWRDFDAEQVLAMTRRKQYAILLEE